MGQFVSTSSQQQTADDGITWWCKFFARACGTIGGLSKYCIFTGT